jgi:transposase, IS5 family
MRGQAGFFEVDERLQQLSAKGDRLERLNAVIDFELFRADLERAVPRADRVKGGRPAFDHVLMFKTLILQANHNLSDERTEYLIRDRLSFMRFLGLGLADNVPDANTIWTFREALTRAKIAGQPAIEVVFERFDAALAATGFLAMSGQIIAASIVAAPKQRNTDGEKRDIKQGRIPAAWAGQPAKLQQKDRDARWTVKYTKAKPSADGASRVDLAVPAFGYKNHVGIDRRHRLIRRWTVTDAARHDGALLPELIDTNNTASEVWADTAYRSKANEKVLAGRLLRSQIHRKKPESLPRRRPGASRCRVAPLGPMPASRQCVRRSNTSSPARKGRWACSSAPSAWPARAPRSALPTSSTTCSGWSGWRPRPHQPDPKIR